MPDVSGRAKRRLASYGRSDYILLCLVLKVEHLDFYECSGFRCYAYTPILFPVVPHLTAITILFKWGCAKDDSRKACIKNFERSSLLLFLLSYFQQQVFGLVLQHIWVTDATFLRLDLHGNENVGICEKQEPVAFHNMDRHYCCCSAAQSTLFIKPPFLLQCPLSMACANGSEAQKKAALGRDDPKTASLSRRVILFTKLVFKGRLLRALSEATANMLISYSRLIDALHTSMLKIARVFYLSHNFSISSQLATDSIVSEVLE